LAAGRPDHLDTTNEAAVRAAFPIHLEQHP